MVNRTASDEKLAKGLGTRQYDTFMLLHRFGPGLSTAVLSTLGSSTLGSSTLGLSTPVSSTNRYLDFKVRLTYFCIDLANFLMIIQPLIYIEGFGC